MIPLLLEVVDYLFDKGKKILQERVERQKAEKNVDAVKIEVSHELPMQEEKAAEAITSRDAALSQEISQSAWLNSEAKIKHLTSLVKIHTRNYYLAKEQYAKWGSALVPPIVVNNLTEAENAVAETIGALQLELGKVYDKRIVLQEG